MPEPGWCCSSGAATLGDATSRPPSQPYSRALPNMAQVSPVSTAPTRQKLIRGIRKRSGCPQSARLEWRSDGRQAPLPSREGVSTLGPRASESSALQMRPVLECRRQVRVAGGLYMAWPNRAAATTMYRLPTRTYEKTNTHTHPLPCPWYPPRLAPLVMFDPTNPVPAANR